MNNSATVNSAGVTCRRKRGARLQGEEKHKDAESDGYIRIPHGTDGDFCVRGMRGWALSPLQLDLQTNALRFVFDDKPVKDEDTPESVSWGFMPRRCSLCRLVCFCQCLSRYIAIHLPCSSDWRKATKSMSLYHRQGAPAHRHGIRVPTSSFCVVWTQEPWNRFPVEGCCNLGEIATKVTSYSLNYESGAAGEHGEKS